MSKTFPASVDAWRMVTARRSFQGRLPLTGMPRLASMLAGTEGQADCLLDFGRDSLGMAYLALQAEIALPLLCQRSLEPFLLPVTVATRLGLISKESEQPGLPAEYEPLLVPADGKLSLAGLVEDELILAVPLVPVNPASAPVEGAYPVSAHLLAGDAAEDDHPFARLRELKK